MESVPLWTLAQHLRDRAWVDLKVDDDRGWLVQRVRLERICVHVDKDLISVRQEWVEDTDEPFGHQELTFDCDALFKVLPTNYHIEQVRPYGRLPGATLHASGSDMDEHSTEVVKVIVLAIAHKFGVDPALLAKYDSHGSPGRIPSDMTGCRYDALILSYDMTQVSTYNLCAAFGYCSVMPMQCARRRLSDRTRDSGPLRQRLRQIAREVDKRFTEPPRRMPATHRVVL